MNTATPTPAPSSRPDELRDKPAWYQRFGRTEIPLAVYAAIFITMAVLWMIQEVHPDVTLGMLTELMGAAFTLFIIDTLLVRSKARRWKLVEEHMDYLISRNVNRLRDSIAVRVLGFNPQLVAGLSETEQVEAVREQRAELLSRMERQRPEQLAAQISETGLFTDASYFYMNERADDVWDVLNMKYSEYMAPDLVLALIRLHTHIKDLCGHIRQYARAERFPEDADYYHRIGRMGASVSVREILKVVNELKQQGYSEPAALTGAEETRLAGVNA